MTKIRFKKKKIYPNLLLGSLWVGLGIVDVIIDGDLNAFKYIYIVSGILYLFHFVYDLKHQYLKIENQTIQKNFLYGGWNKKLRLEEISAIEKTNLHYTLRTDSDKLKINADLIEDESYQELKSILRGLNLAEDKTPKLI